MIILIVLCVILSTMLAAVLMKLHEGNNTLKFIAVVLSLVGAVLIQTVVGIFVGLMMIGDYYKEVKYGDE